MTDAVERKHSLLLPPSPIDDFSCPYVWLHDKLLYKDEMMYVKQFYQLLTHIHMHINRC